MPADDNQIDPMTGKTFAELRKASQDAGKSAPPPPDYTGAAEKAAASDQANVNAQTLQNRPDQTNAYGSTVQWEIGPDGRPRQVQSFAGPLGQLNSSLQGQAASNMATPFSFNGPGLMSGDAARNQAINAAYGQSTSRLDPMWNQRQEALTSQLLNQGLDPSSEAYRNAMGDFSRERNDAYQGALNSAIGQGTEAGNSVFQNSLAAHNTAYGEQLGQRELPLADLAKLAGFTGQAGFNTAGRVGPTDYLGAAGMQDASDFRKYQADAQARAQLMSELFSLPGDILPFFFPGK